MLRVLLLLLPNYKTFLTKMDKMWFVGSKWGANMGSKFGLIGSNGSTIIQVWIKWDRRGTNWQIWDRNWAKMARNSCKWLIIAKVHNNTNYDLNLVNNNWFFIKNTFSSKSFGILIYFVKYIWKRIPIYTVTNF